jgi:penicillin-binding protein 1C
VELTGGDLVVRVQNGVAPFTWLADGLPVAIASHDRQEVLPMPGPGFVNLSVIDGQGRSAGVSVRLVP